MSNISFRKNNSGVLRVTDVVSPLFIEHEYFGFTDNNYPFDSYQFKEMLDQKQISLVNVDENSKYYPFLKSLIVSDDKHEEQLKVKEDAKKKAEEKAKAEAILLDKKKEKEEQLKAKAQKKEEDKLKNRKVKIVTGEDISNSITNNL